MRSTAYADIRIHYRLDGPAPRVGSWDLTKLMNVEGPSFTDSRRENWQGDLALFLNGLASVLACVRGDGQHPDLIPG